MYDSHLTAAVLLSGHLKLSSLLHDSLCFSDTVKLPVKMAQYSFDGEYRRMPQQSYGGASKVEERSELIRRAQAERLKREVHKLVVELNFCEFHGLSTGFMSCIPFLLPHRSRDES